MYGIRTAGSRDWSFGPNSATSAIPVKSMSLSREKKEESCGNAP